MPHDSCPFPENEAQRLEAVRSCNILDTPPEVDFDALTRVAAHSFDTPVAVVGLMDSDRLWFKSKLGLEVPQLDRRIAFCAHALMLPDQLLVVEDLTRDPCFMDNPLWSQARRICAFMPAPHSMMRRATPLAPLPSWTTSRACSGKRTGMFCTISPPWR